MADPITRNDIAEIHMTLAKKRAHSSNFSGARKAWQTATTIMSVQELEDTQWQRAVQIHQLRELAVGMHPAPEQTRITRTRKLSRRKNRTLL